MYLSSEQVWSSLLQLSVSSRRFCLIICLYTYSFFLTAAKSFWLPFKTKVQDTGQQHLTLLKDWELLILS